jgi:hypothetical protein
MMAGSDSQNWKSDDRAIGAEQVAPVATPMAAPGPPSRAVRAESGFGQYLPKLPVSLDSGSADPEIHHAAVLGYN